jgi:transcriptional regulator with XRE-family HTH domain
MLGYYLKYMRIERGLTQKELSKKLFIAPCTLSHYENGSRMVPYSVFERAMHILNFSMHVIDSKTKKEITNLEINRIKN